MKRDVSNDGKKKSTSNDGAQTAKNTQQSMNHLLDSNEYFWAEVVLLVLNTSLCWFFEMVWHLFLFLNRVYIDTSCFNCTRHSHATLVWLHEKALRVRETTNLTSKESFMLLFVNNWDWSFNCVTMLMVIFRALILIRH